MYRTIRLLVRSFVEPFSQRVLPDDIEVLIVSPGGVGTTFFIEYIMKFKRTNDPYDRDRLKHLCRPPNSILQLGDCRVIMITGDEEDIYASLKRRGWDRIQSARLGSPVGVIGPAELAKNAFKKAVKNQAESWGNAGLNLYLVVRYEDLWDKVDEVARFLEIEDPSFAKNFPERKNRLSKPGAELGR